MQINEPRLIGFGNATNVFLNGRMPVACATFEAWVGMKDGRQETNPYLHFGVYLTKAVDKLLIITVEMAVVVGPVAWVGVVES